MRIARTLLSTTLAVAAASALVACGQGPIAPGLAAQARAAALKARNLEGWDDPIVLEDWDETENDYEDLSPTNHPFFAPLTFTVVRAAGAMFEQQFLQVVPLGHTFRCAHRRRVFEAGEILGEQASMTLFAEAEISGQAACTGGLPRDDAGEKESVGVAAGGRRDADGQQIDQQACAPERSVGGVHDCRAYLLGYSTSRSSSRTII